MTWMFLILSCSLNEPSPQKTLIDTSAENQTTGDTSEPSDNEDIPNFIVIEENPTNNTWQLAHRSLNNWNSSTVIRSNISEESKIKTKHGYLWLFERGTAAKEAIAQYDPQDLSQPLGRYEFTAQGNTPVYPNDITICNEKIFVTMYNATDILVLNEQSFEEIARISISEYADEDGLPEASTLLCKNNYVFVSLHRLDRRPTPSTQLGSIWLVFDPNTYEEIINFGDQGFKSDIIDVPKTSYIGSVIRPHIDVFGTTGFWVFDVLTEIFYSQIYFAFNDKTIFDTAVGNQKITHLATNYSDNATWMFCHDFTPGIDIAGYSYEELVPVSHEFIAVTMNEDDEAWLILKSLDPNSQYSLLPIDSNTCMAKENEIFSDVKITDFEIIFQESDL
jgi:hypothetical protein